MAHIPKWVKCVECGGRATLGLSTGLLTSHVRNAAINQKTKDIFRFVFGSKKASKLKTTKDIDAAFRDVARRYPHLMPGYKRGERYDARSDSDMSRLGAPDVSSCDPFPKEKITDCRGLNPERRMR
jgi:hypothetical protein